MGKTSRSKRKKLTVSNMKEVHNDGFWNQEAEDVLDTLEASMNKALLADHATGIQHVLFVLDGYAKKSEDFRTALLRRAEKQVLEHTGEPLSRFL
ncbi:MAG: hypothetical protein AAF581_06640 [Planctomycetota bacterium]